MENASRVGMNIFVSVLTLCLLCNVNWAWADSAVCTADQAIKRISKLYKHSEHRGRTRSSRFKITARPIGTSVVNCSVLEYAIGADNCDDAISWFNSAAVVHDNFEAKGLICRYRITVKSGFGANRTVMIYRVNGKYKMVKS